MQLIKQQIDIRLITLKQANQALHELTVDLSLLDAVSEMTAKVSKALDLLMEQGDGLTDKDFIALLSDSEAIDVLDEIVDTDAVSELEDRFFMVIGSMEDNEMGEFLTELIEKIEIRYSDLVEAIHELNALLNIDG
ncbi:MAG: hypothetical protein GQ532_01810 [Methylomarinum sp.]|nr:hypothetical protein [Methylomarinum sp.]